jgi:hypothetical protein
MMHVVVHDVRDVQPAALALPPQKEGKKLTAPVELSLCAAFRPSLRKCFRGPILRSNLPHCYSVSR